MNKLIIIGHVGKDIHINQVNGKQVGNFSVAVSRKTQQGETTTWFDVGLWDKPNVYPFIRKGDKICVEGEVSVNVYQKNDGTAAASLRVSAHQVHLLGSKPQEGQQTSPVDQQGVVPVDDLPF